jgi:Tfp pilus tip-associated adhesin PilY1
VAALVKGYSTETPVLIFGGGYDSCEDADTKTPTCSGRTGGYIYILNANDGTLLRKFETSRAVAADVALADIDNDGMPDYAYAATTGGSIYRVDFYSQTTGAPLTSANWTSREVASTTTGGRKFLFPPAVFVTSKKIYLAIGSGDREHPLASQYPYANVRNRFYVTVDDLTAAASTPVLDLDTTPTMYDATETNSCSATKVLPDSGPKGWFIDLKAGEQVVTSALIAGGMVTFSTNRPIVTGASCSTSLGEAAGYWLNLLNGSGAVGVTGTCGGQRSALFVGGGLPPSPVMATGVPIDNKPTTVVIGAVQRSGGASVAIAPQTVPPAISSRRTRTYNYTKGQ